MRPFSLWRLLYEAGIAAFISRISILCSRMTRHASFLHLPQQVATPKSLEICWNESAPNSTVWRISFSVMALQMQMYILVAPGTETHVAKLIYGAIAAINKTHISTLDEMGILVENDSYSN